MDDLFGTSIEKSQLLMRIGDMSQVCGIRRMMYTEGKSAGVHVVEVSTGSGLEFTVLPSRGLDVSSAVYRGVPLAWRSPVGDASPFLFRPDGNEWLRSFFGGLLTTCGMTYASHPCEDEGEKLGLHGRVSNIPAEDVGIERGWHGHDYRMKVSGKVREAKMFGENLVLTRIVETSLGARNITIRDRIENCGFRPSPLMMLYHVNIGWPVVSEESRLLSPTLRVIPADDRARSESDLWPSFIPPQREYEERVYFHDLQPDTEGVILLGIVNPQLEIGVYLRYLHREFPHFVEWKMMGEGEYVVGIEPGNITGNRAAMRKDGTLEFLDPGAERRFTLEIGVLDGMGDITTFTQSVEESLARRTDDTPN